MKRLRTEAEQVVITGAGLVTPLGVSRELTWRAVLDNRCGIAPLTAMESALSQGCDGGEAPALPADFYPDLPRETRYLRHAIREAVTDAGFVANTSYPRDRCGIILGTTLHGMRSGGRFLRSGDHAELSHFLAGPVLRDAVAGLGLEGCAMTTCSACSSSLGAVALGLSMLRAGELDLVLAGGYDAISEYAYGGFNSLRLVASGPLRPFARERQGMKVSEGYGIVVMERSAGARSRGARPLATVLGYGESADAHHLTQPHPQGEGAARAMRQALADAGVADADVDLAAAHATGTPDNDSGEFAALSAVFGAELRRLPVVAFKSHLGHTLGGAGAVELVLSAMALRDQVVPACANVRAEEVEYPGLQLSTGSPKPARIHTTLNTSLGFGGANTSVVLGPAGAIALPEAPAPSVASRDVFITGVGVVFPGHVGNEAFARHLRECSQAVERDTGAVSEAQIETLLNARRVRRMSEYVKLSLAATTLCFRDAGIDDVAGFAQTAAAVLGTAHGSTNYCESYYGQIVNEGLGAANPMLFAEGVPNAAAAHMSLMLALKGPCQTIIGSRTAGLDALRVAATRIRAGEWDRAVVGAAEEYSPVVNEAYRHQGLYGKAGYVAGAGAVTLLLESRASIEARGGRALARIDGAAGATASSPAGMARLSRRVYDQLGRPRHVVCSANDTWIGRAELAGARDGEVVAASPYGYVADCSSVMPLAGIAAVLLTGTLPRQLSSTPPAAGTEGVTKFGVVAADYAGAVAGIAVERL